MNNRLRIATRKSALAMWQANHVSELLRKAHTGLEIELLPIVTQGDRIIDRPLSEIGGKGLFLKELEQALIDGRADLAVHSMKDVPAEMTGELVLDGVLPRANPFDAFVSRDGSCFADLTAGDCIGTSSLRRQCQVLSLRPDLVVKDLRGNVDTRLRKLDEGQYDAIILACAGLERLGWGEKITEVLSLPAWLPAATQGIIGLQCRRSDEKTRALISPLADPDTAVVAKAERAVARVLQATCQVPLAAYAVLEDGVVNLTSMLGTPDGGHILRACARAPAVDAVALGEQVAEQLIEQGALQIMSGL